jgi:hypothetical protein
VVASFRGSAVTASLCCTVLAAVVKAAELGFLLAVFAEIVVDGNCLCSFAGITAGFTAMLVVAVSRLRLTKLSTE